MLYREGEACTSLYIVIGGEFEARKKAKGFYNRLKARQNAKQVDQKQGVIPK